MGGQVDVGQPDLGNDDGERFLIGIDPGSVTGVCVFGVKSREIKSLYTLDFWRTHDLIVRSYHSKKHLVQIYIEQPSLIKYLYTRHREALKEHGSKPETRDKMVWNSAENAREGILLRDGFRRFGFTVFDCRPIGRKKWTAAEFSSAMKYPYHSNQHVRDAAFLVHDKGWFIGGENISPR